MALAVELGCPSRQDGPHRGSQTSERQAIEHRTGTVWRMRSVTADPAPEAYREGGVSLQLGQGFFRPESRPSRDLGVLLCRSLMACREGLGANPPVRVLDLMAGCGIRSLRLAVEGGAASVWANDADPGRLPLLRANLASLAALPHRCTALTAQKLLAACLLRQQRFELVDLDAFGSVAGLLPLALEAVAFEGVLYLASSDGRSPTGHDRPAAIRSLGAAARAHPASWELALRLQIGQVARLAWAQGWGIEPLFSFSEGRTFRTAIQLRRRPRVGEEQQLGLLAHCHGCGDQQLQSLLKLRGWAPCLCPEDPQQRQGGRPLAISGPLWLGPLQNGAWLERLHQAALALPPGWQAPASQRLLQALMADPGLPARCWPMAELSRRLPTGTPRLAGLLEALRQEGWCAHRSGVMAGMLRSDAPWARILELAAALAPPGPN